MKIALMICLGLVAGAVMSVVELIALIVLNVACVNFEVVLFKHALVFVIVVFVGAYVSVQLWTLYHMARFNKIFAAALTSAVGMMILLLYFWSKYEIPYIP